jgi:ElaB/YqjD/DUF883 family membrane-anchored ribosome-binding protein
MVAVGFMHTVVGMDAARKLKKLVDDTEELLETLADEQGPKIDAVRERLLVSLERTKRAIAEQRRNRKDGKNGQARDEEDEEDDTSIGVRDLAGSLNDYVRTHPWIALATGILVATSAGILATSATKRSYRHGP